MINCGECSGSKQSLCMEYFDDYKQKFFDDMESNTVDIDPFTAVQSIGLLGRVFSGDSTALEEIAEDPLLGSGVKAGQEAASKLVSDVRGIGCTLEPRQIALKGIISSIQEAILEEAAETADYDSLLPTTKDTGYTLLGGLEDDDNISDDFKQRAKELDDLLVKVEARTRNRPKYQTSAQREERLRSLIGDTNELFGSVDRIIEVTKKDIEADKQNARSTYVQEQNWDIENLDFSQKLEIKAYLKELGYK